ncbi:MAG: hypothetical protein ACXU8N_18325 [Telluria sp.]
MNHSAISPSLDAEQQDSTQVAALAGSQVSPSSALPSRRPEVSDIDKHLDAVLRASGSALRYFSMPKTLEDMREAMRAAVASGSWTPASYPPDADITVMLALTDGEVWQGYWNGEDWIEVSGLVVTKRVKYWQHTPTHPEDCA